MRTILAVAALLAASACSKPAEAPEAEASAAPKVAAGPVAADGQSSVGMFKVTGADGKVYMDDVRADGTFETKLDGKVIETGKWDQKSPNLYCYTKDAPDAKEECNEEKVENGVWTTKDPEGKVSTVERVTS
jgi:hypothetical protein